MTVIDYDNLVIGILLLIVGAIFYGIFRQFDPLSLGFNHVRLFDSYLYYIPKILLYSLPSFIHVAALSFLSLSHKGINQRLSFRIILFWVLANILFEILQSDYLTGLKIISGTSDIMDMWFSIVAGIVIYLFIKRKNKITSQTIKSPTATRQQNNNLFCCMVLLVSTLMLGCDGRIFGTPIYMSYSDLRSSFVIEKNHPVTEIGKIMLKESFLLINESNEGIHIYDNNDPKNPIYQGFIVIPGNLDMDIKDGFLFADSYIDLIVVDLNDLDNISIVRRIENTYPYDPHQNMGYVILLNLDRSKGVVIDYIDEGVSK